jgi:ComF family protein
MILRFKHADDIHSADLFAGWLARLMEDLDKPSTSNHDPDLILPVPLHLFRHIKRGYNQSSLLAHHLSGQTGIKTSDTILRRVKPTPSQGGLSPVERANNVNDAFAIADGKASELKDRHIILVDDVRTTGATLESCAGVLKQAGASEITGLTIARVI